MSSPGLEDDDSNLDPVTPKPPRRRPSMSRQFSPDSDIPLITTRNMRHRSIFSLGLPRSSPILERSSPIRAPEPEHDPNELDSDDRAFLNTVSSPWVGEKAARKKQEVLGEKKKLGRELATARRLETLQLSRIQEEKTAEERRLDVYAHISELLEDEGLDAGGLFLHVLDPKAKQGEARWALFRRPEFMKQLLDSLAAGNTTMRRQLLDWSTAHVQDAVTNEAQLITASKDLHANNKAIDADFVTRFDIHAKFDYLCDQAPVFMRVIRGFASASRHAVAGPTRELKKILVCYSCSTWPYRF